jgi:hypothetical protein
MQKRSKSAYACLLYRNMKVSGFSLLIAARNPRPKTKRNQKTMTKRIKDGTHGQGDKVALGKADILAAVF